VSAADAVATALFSTAGKVRLPILGDGYLEIDKRGITRLKKEQVE